jgi:DNA-binding transcriptional LysR family regulator
MFMGSMTTRAPVGSRRPAGDCVNGCANVPSIHVWPAMSWPSAMMIPRRMVRGLVSAGLGIALVPGIAAPAVPHGVRWIPVRGQGDALRRRVCAVTAPGPSPAAQAMARALHDQATQSA